MPTPPSAAAQPFLFPTNPVPVVLLAWSIVGSATNYNLYYGVVTGGYTNKTPVGPVLNATLPLPARGVKFFFAVTAQAGGLESPFSNEVSYTAPAPPPAPVLQPPLEQSPEQPPVAFRLQRVLESTHVMPDAPEKRKRGRPPKDPI